MSSAPRILPAPFGAPGSLGRRFADLDPVAVELFSPVDGGTPGRASDHPPPSCRTAGLTADAFGHASGGSREKLEAILSGEGAFVTTGQQPCLFLGPLLVLYKAITAIELAAALERRHGRPVLALFWVASDDHDWEEVGTASLVDTTNALRSFRLVPPAGWERRSVGRATPGDAIVGLLDDVEQALPRSEFIDHYLTLLREAYRPTAPLGRAFGEALAGVLQGRQLVWLDSASSTVKRALAPFHRRALLEADAAGAAVASSTERVRRAGFEPQLAVPAGASNLFYDDGQARERVYVEEGEARWGRDGERCPVDELATEVERNPEAFGPSAALRPVAESCLLPVVASVLGPAEAGYWAQLPELFRWSGVSMPRTVPRTSWTMIEGKVADVLASLEVSPEELADGGRAVADRAVQEGRPAEIARALEELSASREAAFDRVTEAVAAELPGIRATAEKARANARKAAQLLEKAVDAAVRERQATLRQKVDKAALHLYPAGSPQERVLNPLYYLSRYGVEFLHALDREVRTAVEQYVARPDEGG